MMGESPMASGWTGEHQEDATGCRGVLRGALGHCTGQESSAGSIEVLHVAGAARLVRVLSSVFALG